MTASESLKRIIAGVAKLDAEHAEMKAFLESLEWGVQDSLKRGTTFSFSMADKFTLLRLLKKQPLSWVKKHSLL